LKAERLLLAALAGVLFLALDLGDLGEANVIVAREEWRLMSTLTSKSNHGLGTFYWYSAKGTYGRFGSVESPCSARCSFLYFSA
jgi:hypothetical protein